MADKQWPEVEQAFREKRRELVLSGQEITDRIDKDGLDETIYRMAKLNFLEICKTSLHTLDEKLGNMENLTNLVLHSNHIKVVPATVGKLVHLKMLDLSRNQIEELPEEFGQLKELHTVNVSENRLSALPNVGELPNLHVINFSSNQFEEFPEGLSSPELKLLNTIVGSFNSMTSLPAGVNNLVSLKHLDLNNNKLQEVAPELSECIKLKELDLKENKFKDRRFGKLVQQCQTKSVLDYLAKILVEREKAAGKNAKPKKDRKKKKVGGNEDEAAAPKNVIAVKHFKEESGVVIQVEEELVGDVRPFIVCCVVRNVNLSNSRFKAFISAQTKLHDTLCDKRQKATIATHDLKSLSLTATEDGNPPLLYTAKKPEELKLIPLFRHNETTADKLVGNLRREAEELRKDKKRHNFSGIHKYLDLLKNKSLYPCLLMRETDEVISFPPITNCQVSKVSQETKDILIEVTSSTNLDICKKVMDELLTIMLEKGLGTAENTCDEAAGGEPSAVDSVDQSQKSLVVEQVKILDQNMQLKVVYPSRTDLQRETYLVEREN